ncbi:MAG: hypothetical protein RBR40_14510, partial [Tenuifilaceae bacterium]|nr:hypothetical protein [Tenuifilaceae bacterium]
MKRIILTLLISSLGLVATLAQSQLGMNYQAVVRNTEGKIIADTKVGIRITILKESTSGESVYIETFTPTTNEFGLITLVIGQGQTKYGKYSSIDWSSAKYFLKIEFDIAGGTAYEEMGVSQLLSVPYANYAFNGVGGKSAYQIWIDRGNTGSEEDFFNSLTGPSGKSAYQVWLDLGNTGTLQDFINSISAVGRSVYDIWLGLGNTGTQQDFINSITGQSGPSGKSAYQVWLEQPGNDAKTEEDFINSITGVSGKSAYQVWLDLGNIGTEDAFISSLTGPSGTSSWDDAETNVSTKNKVQVISDGKNPEVPLLEVKNSKGETIFAVYENGVKIILDEETGGEKNRGGFAISGRTTTK